ncbi:MAG TPA: Holliday junction resolvase RuvX [Candidatus Binatia bacterium]|nr:Holliday junction resolvase RuvX [Candidatus Binatia bacterium]
MQKAPKQLLALDVGDKRIGVALASQLARLAAPYTTLQRSDQTLEDLKQLVEAENIVIVVVGLPRGLAGQETAQTKLTKDFGEQLKAKLNIPVFWQDEAATSIKAETELDTRRKISTKADVDALAATYILEDFLRDNPGEVS